MNVVRQIRELLAKKARRLTQAGVGLESLQLALQGSLTIRMRFAVGEDLRVAAGR